MKPQHSKLLIASLLLIVFLDSIGWGIIYPVLSPILLHNTNHIFPATTSIDVRNFWYEAMIGFYMLCMFIASPLLGSLSDRFGRRSVLTLSMLGNAVGFCVCGLGVLHSSLLLLTVGRVVSGFTAGSLPIAQAAMMDISTPEQKPKRLSFVTLANVTGFAVGPVIGALCLDWTSLGVFSFSLPLWLIACLALLGGILIFTTLPETFVGCNAVKINPLTGFVNLFKAFKQKATRRLCLTFLFFMLSWAMFFSTVPLDLTEHFAFSSTVVGYFISFIAVFLGVGVIYIMPYLLKIARLQTIARYSFVSLLVGMLVFMLSSSEVVLWLSMIFTVAVPFAYIAIASLLSEAVTGNEQGMIMGVLGSLIAFTWGVGPLLLWMFSSMSFYIAGAVTCALIVSAFLVFSWGCKSE